MVHCLEDPCWIRPRALAELRCKRGFEDDPRRKEIVDGSS